MEILKIVAIGVISSILAISLKKQNPEMSIFISISAGVILFMMVVPQIASVINMITSISDNIDIDKIYISIVLKIIGIAYIAEFGVQICKDTGESAIASKIEFVGKVLIMVVSAPILIALMELILTMMP